MCSSAAPGVQCRASTRSNTCARPCRATVYEYRSDPQDIIQRALAIPGSSEVDTIIELYAQDSPKAEYKWDADTQAWHLVN
jgi:hypothetical protein